MKVLFVIPTNIGRYVKPTVPHAGIAYLAGVLLRAGHSVEIHDMRVYPNEEDLIKKVREYKPEMIGLTTASRGYMITYRVIGLLKNSFPEIVVLIGGSHASTIKEKILEETKADFAIIMEGEETILEVVNRVPLKEIRGLIWRDKGRIIKNPERPPNQNLDEMPFPAYEKFELDKFLENRLPIVSSRGCPAQCNFCSVQLVMGRVWRARSAENVVSELEYWYKRGFKTFEFTDDNFSFDLERAEKICDLIVEKGLEIKFELGNGIRADRITERLAKKLKRAGCCFIAFGLESGNRAVLKKIKKGIIPETAERAVEMAKDAGIPVQVNFIVGCAGETWESFMDSYNLAKKLNPDQLRFFNMIPYPGSEMFEWVKQNGTFLYPPEEYLNDISYWKEDPVFETPEFSKEERIKAYKVGEGVVMELFFKRQFGKFGGGVLYHIWKNRFIRKNFETVGIRTYTVLKKIRRKLTS